MDYLVFILKIFYNEVPIYKLINISMLYSPESTIKDSKEWIILGKKSNSSSANPPMTPRAVYSFQSRLRHIDTRKNARAKSNSHDYKFPFNSAFKETDFYRKFPIRKGPPSVRSKRSMIDCIDILGTQLIFVSNKKNNRFY